MGDKETCCCCFPLDCGIKTLGAWVLIGIGIFSFQCYTTEGLWDIFWPTMVAYVAMGIVFLYTFLADSEQSRKFALLAWIVLVCVVARCWYLYVILNGKTQEMACTTTSIE